MINKAQSYSNKAAMFSGEKKKNCLGTFYCVLIESQGDGITRQEGKKKKIGRLTW